MALVEASKIYRKHLNPFILPVDGGSGAPQGVFGGVKSSEEAAKKATLKEVLSRPISSLDLSVRAANCMADQQIQTVGELARRSKDDMLLVKNFGKTSLHEIEKKLSELGLALGMDVDAVLNS